MNTKYSGPIYIQNILLMNSLEINWIMDETWARRHSFKLRMGCQMKEEQYFNYEYCHQYPEYVWRFRMWQENKPDASLQ